MKRTKKVILIILTLIMVLSLTACGGATAAKLPELAPPAESGVEPTVKTMSDSDCDDSLEGLRKFLEGNEIITGESSEMEYKVIGAVAGVKYNFTYKTKSVQVELYEFDTASASNEYIESVKANGTFKVLDAEVPAVLTKTEKYMMVYTDNDKAEQNVNQKKKAIELFEGFKSTSTD